MNDLTPPNIAKLDKTISNKINDACNVWHLSGFYDDLTSVSLIQEGFELAYDIIYKIKPAD